MSSAPVRRRSGPAKRLFYQLEAGDFAGLATVPGYCEEAIFIVVSDDASIGGPVRRRDGPGNGHSPLLSRAQLEQLRILEHGIPIKVVETEFDSIGVDTPEDLARAEARLRQATVGADRRTQV